MPAENREIGLSAMNNDSIRKKLCAARVATEQMQALNAGTKLCASRLIIDPRDGNLKLANNPVLLMTDMIKRTFDGSLQFVDEMERELSTAINYCDGYIWIEKENGEIKGI
ncbi:MAG: hypothetical protein CVU74_00045 [Deltaproteobacteria bacterium HGW-Deltaproteobacteria-9]|nr:MAG: hypothetical protein CVU74_00045 [Deltaproteobacteria bacterium HGW-Deltaproteobacteria-9]